MINARSPEVESLDSLDFFILTPRKLVLTGLHQLEVTSFKKGHQLRMPFWKAKRRPWWALYSPKVRIRMGEMREDIVLLFTISSRVSLTESCILSWWE